MIKKIILENFMAHEHTELELGPGVNALTGPNNTGKSAIVEGLRCLMSNPTPKHYIRHGAKEARVSVELEDGTRVVWVRKKRSPGYEIWAPGAEEPQEYWKLGRGKVPQDVLDVLKLDLVELENDKVDVHIGNQREPVFLINKPGSNAAAFFAASSESAHLLAMQNLLKRKTQDAKRTERDLLGRLGGIEEELDEFSALPDLFLQAEAARDLETTTKKLQAEIPALQETLQRGEEIEKSLNISRFSATVLNTLTDTPMLHDVRQLFDTTSQLEQVADTLSTTSKKQNVLADLAAVSEIFDTPRLAGLCKSLRQTEHTLQKAVVISAASDRIQEPPQLNDMQQLTALLNQIYEVRSRTSRLSGWGNALQSLAEPPEVEPLSPLESLLGEMRNVMRRKGDGEAALSRLENGLESMRKDIEARVEAIGSCPTCGADLNSTQFLDRGCRHGQ